MIQRSWAVTSRCEFSIASMVTQTCYIGHIKAHLQCRETTALARLGIVPSWLALENDITKAVLKDWWRQIGEESEVKSKSTQLNYNTL